jgi:hypothetical protein
VSPIVTSADTFRDTRIVRRPRPNRKLGFVASEVPFDVDP